LVAEHQCCCCANFIAVFGTMIVGGIGAAAALMLGDQIFEEE